MTLAAELHGTHSAASRGHKTQPSGKGSSRDRLRISGEEPALVAVEPVLTRMAARVALGVALAEKPPRVASGGGFEDDPSLLSDMRSDWTSGAQLTQHIIHGWAGRHVHV